ncbi:MAG: response regulator [Oryzomonas sp.]|jgi:CheY-like chemotaxis protein
MDGYTILHEILASALKQAGEESGMLLGQELAISLSDSLTTSKTSYFSGVDDSCFVIGVESREAYTGQFFLLFSLRDAIVMSSILLGIPPARIQEKRRLCIIENDDIDAFAEIANMINGAFNTVFQGSLPNKAHLKLLTPKKFIPDIDELSETEPLPEGDYLMFRSKLEMPGQELNYLDVLIPVELGNQFDPPSEEPPAQSAEEEAAQPAPAEGTSSEPQTKVAAASLEAGPAEDGIDSVVVLGDDHEERSQMVAAAGSSGYQVVEGTLNADIKDLFAGRNVRLVLIGAQDANDHELAVCIKVNAIRQDSPPPIIMSAQRWTRTAVLKALKYGAREIIIKPCSEQELIAKVRRFCKPPVQ